MASAKGALQVMPGLATWVSTVYLTSAAVNSTPSLQSTPLRSLAVISVKSALYCHGSLANSLYIEPLRPLSGSMNHRVSITNWWLPLELAAPLPATHRLKLPGLVEG